MTQIRDRLVALDHAWRRLEIGLACLVVGLEVATLTVWVLLAGLASPLSSASLGGWMIRALVGALAGGLLAYRCGSWFGRLPALAGIGGAGVGFAIAPLWRSFPVEYASNLLGWLQQASTLTLFGGLRGIAARLTLVLLFVGASLATSRNAHITIDLVTRALPRALARWVAVGTYLSSALVCASTGWAFFDQISIGNFSAPAEGTVARKAQAVATGLGEHAFALRKQLELDVRSVVPVVIQGRSYSRWLEGSTWNAWLASAGFPERYGKAATERLRISPEQYRAPIVVLPEIGEPNSQLNHSADLLFPVGFVVLTLRFLLAAARRATEEPAPEALEPTEEANPC